MDFVVFKENGKSTPEQLLHVFIEEAVYFSSIAVCVLCMCQFWNVLAHCDFSFDDFSFRDFSFRDRFHFDGMPAARAEE